MKAKRKPHASTVIKNCSFHVHPEPEMAIAERARAVIAVAEAFTKLAETLKTGTFSTPIINIDGGKSKDKT